MPDVKTKVLQKRNVVEVLDFDTERDDRLFDTDYYVEGYAATFDRYVLYEHDGVAYYEQFDRNAFDDAHMEDIVFLYDHEGRVLARSTNNTLKVSVDNHGLKVAADLSLSDAGRSVHADIQSGLINQMSWAYTVSDYYYDQETRTSHIRKVGRVYDVSAVAIPANDGTEISARSFMADVLEQNDKHNDVKLRQRQLSLRLRSESNL